MARPKLKPEEEYQNYAEHCLTLAQLVFDHESRMILREMAAEWLRLTRQE